MESLVAKREKIEQIVLGLAFILGAVALFFRTFELYWFNSGATTEGKVANIAIPLIFVALGLYYLVGKDSLASFWRKLLGSKSIA